MTEGNLDYHDRTVSLAIIGVALLLVGLVAAVYAPAELGVIIVSRRHFANR
jgi:uncharacterized membrane protein YiaA